MRSAGDEAGLGVQLAAPKPARYVSPRTVALYGVLTALATAVTYTTAAPFSPTKGYFNLGDSMVFFSAFTFGWRAGMICGGVGSATADILLGFGIYAPLTLVAKGTEGAVAGLVCGMGKSKHWAMVLGVVAGGACMITLYFLGEWLVLDVGFGKAIAEIPVNVTQVGVGGTVGILLSALVRRSYKPMAQR